MPAPVATFTTVTLTRSPSEIPDASVADFCRRTARLFPHRRTRASMYLQHVSTWRYLRATPSITIFLRVARLALFPEELLEVVGPSGGLIRRRARLPPAEGLHAHDGAGRRPAGAVRVRDPRLDSLEELLDLLRILAEDPRGESVIHAVGDFEGVLEAVARNHAQNWNEKFLLVDLVCGWMPVNDRRLDEEAVFERPSVEDASSVEDLAAAPLRELDCHAILRHGVLVDHRPKEDVPLRR